MAAFGLKIYDENGDPIDAKCVGFHYDTGNTSDIHDTQNQESNFDNTDADWDGDSTPVPENDVILLHVYTDDACAVHRIISDNSDSYKRSIQILPCQAPTVAILVNDGLVNVELVANQNSSDEYQWEYDGETMHHKQRWYGTDLCDDVKITKVEYDFGDGYGTDDSYIFDSADTYNIKVKVTNECELTAEDSVDIKVKWNEPSVALSNDPVAPGVDEETTIDSVVTDSDSRVVTETWYMDDVETTELTWSFAEIETHIFKVKLDWNDGFEDKVVWEELVIEMTAAELVVDLTYTNNESIYTMNTAVELGDADLDYIRYEIRYRVPFTNEAILCYNSNGSEIEEFEFANSGVYEVTAIAYDELEINDSDTKIITVECTGTGSSDEYVHYIEWE
ncbi:MAG: hypothetical protein DRP08_06860 [Candidatus Aenigmatarchaeota archaeon]|nr:MAG: hypothetical protein DRP08_06860 [Candidatus Aenigmarchaeota archaeon]